MCCVGGICTLSKFLKSTFRTEVLIHNNNVNLCWNVELILNGYCEVKKCVLNMGIYSRRKYYFPWAISAPYFKSNSYYQVIKIDYQKFKKHWDNKLNLVLERKKTVTYLSIYSLRSTGSWIKNQEYFAAWIPFSQTLIAL